MNPGKGPYTTITNYFFRFSMVLLNGALNIIILAVLNLNYLCKNAKT